MSLDGPSEGVFSAFLFFIFYCGWVECIVESFPNHLRGVFLVGYHEALLAFQWVEGTVKFWRPRCFLECHS